MIFDGHRKNHLGLIAEQRSRLVEVLLRKTKRRLKEQTRLKPRLLKIIAFFAKGPQCRQFWVSNPVPILKIPMQGMDCPAAFSGGLGPDPRTSSGSDTTSFEAGPPSSGSLQLCSGLKPLRGRLLSQFESQPGGEHEMTRLPKKRIDPLTMFFFFFNIYV